MAIISRDREIGVAMSEENGERGRADDEEEGQQEQHKHMQDGGRPIRTRKGGRLLSRRSRWARLQFDA
jgi:hypothetical protein